MHIHNNEYPYTGWKRDFPSVWFPYPRDGIDFPEQEIWWVHETERPGFDPQTQMVVEGQPEQVEGQWRQTWQVVPIPPAPVPAQCSRRQGRLALLQADALDDVESAIAAIEDPGERQAAQIEYEADTWERSNPFLQAMWSQLGGTESELDDLFRSAVTF